MAKCRFRPLPYFPNKHPEETDTTSAIVISLSQALLQRPPDRHPRTPKPRTTHEANGYTSRPSLSPHRPRNAGPAPAADTASELPPNTNTMGRGRGDRPRQAAPAAPTGSASAPVDLPRTQTHRYHTEASSTGPSLALQTTPPYKLRLLSTYSRLQRNHAAHDSYTHTQLHSW